MSIWVTSDLHFNHDREFIWKSRGFSSVQDMNEGIISRWNSVVNPWDAVWILGDICLSGNIAYNKKLISRLNGILHVVRGNHDSTNRLDMYNQCHNIIEVCNGWSEKQTLLERNWLFSHYPTMTANFDDGKRPSRRLINLSGHTHSKNALEHISFGIYNVNMDAHDCYPVNLEDIIRIVDTEFERNKSRG